MLTIGVDAGDSRNDTGINDGGVTGLDAGVINDAGVVEETDAGPPLSSCDFEFETVNHICEGDEDFCAPEPNIVCAAFDALALWSRQDGDSFFVQLLFGGRAMTCRGDILLDFAVLLDRERYSFIR